MVSDVANGLSSGGSRGMAAVVPAQAPDGPVRAALHGGVGDANVPHAIQRDRLGSVALLSRR